MYQQSKTVFDPHSAEGAGIVWKLNDERNKRLAAAAAEAKLKYGPIDDPIQE